MSILITCINKDSGNHENPHTAISNLGWIEDGSGKVGNTSRDQMHDWIKGGGQAYVKDARGDVAYLTAEVSSRGTKFVKTRPDGTKADNLLTLKECT